MCKVLEQSPYQRDLHLASCLMIKTTRQPCLSIGMTKVTNASKSKFWWGPKAADTLAGEDANQDSHSEGQFGRQCSGLSLKCPTKATSWASGEVEGGWGEGSVVTGGYSCRKHTFSYRNPGEQLTNVCNFSSRNPTPSSGLLKHLHSART